MPKRHKAAARPAARTIAARGLPVNSPAWSAQLEQLAVAQQSLPAYHQTQSAFHEAFRAELYRCLDGLPLAADSRVLDVPCGDGFYSARLVTRLGRQGRLDSRRRFGGVPATSCRHACAASRTRLGRFPAGRRLHPAVRRRRVRPGLVRSEPDLAGRPGVGSARAGARHPAGRHCGRAGRRRVPSPAAALAGRAGAVRFDALQQASRDKYGDAGRLAPSRRVRRHLLGAGLRQPRKVSFAADRHAPFDPATARYLAPAPGGPGGPGPAAPARRGAVGVRRLH